MPDQFPRQRTLPDEKSQIVGFRWNELSGVDHGANLEDDFLIIKSEEGSEALEAMLKSEMAIIQGEQALFAALSGFDPDLEGTPAEVKQAAQVLHTWLAEQGYDELMDAADTSLKPYIDPKTGKPKINPVTGKPIMMDPKTGKPVFGTKADGTSDNACTASTCDLATCPGESCDVCTADMCKVIKPVQPTKKDDSEPSEELETKSDKTKPSDGEVNPATENPHATKKPTRGISVKDLLLEVIRTMMGNKPVAKQQEVDEELVFKAISAEFPAFTQQVITILRSGDNSTKSAAITSAVAGLSERIESNVRQ